MATFTFSTNDGRGITASGTITAGQDVGNPNLFHITNVTGTGTVVTPFGTATGTLQGPDNGYSGPNGTPDNLLFYGAGASFLDNRGFSFDAVAVPILGNDSFNVEYNGTGYIANDSQNLAPNDPVTFTVVEVPCYASGTLIRTEAGEVAVEDLAAGDTVVTASGEARAIKWLGHRRVDCRRHPRPEAVWPVRVQAGAFGPGLPARELWLSPDHSVCVTVLDEVFIPVKHLINGATVAQVPVEAVTYWHVELDSHDVILAEGLAAESFLDTGVRAGFENGGEHLVLHPDFAPLSLADFCRPLHQAGPVVDAVRTRLVARGALGWATTGEDDLHVVADGAVIRPDGAGPLARFLIPAGTREVRLVSRSFVPEQVDPESRDGRRLGVPLRGLTLTDGLALHREVAIDDPILAAGFSFVQGDHGERWRWTDGDAHLPSQLWAEATDAFFLTLRRAPDRGTVRAWVAPGRTAERERDRRAA